MYGTVWKPPWVSSFLYHLLFPQFSSVQFSSIAQSCLTISDPMDCSSPGLPVHHQFSELTQTHVHWISEAIQPSHPLSSPSPTFNFSSIKVFSNESVLRIKWPKDWSFSSCISPSSEYSGMISFTMDWLESPRDSQESSPTPQFKSINSSVLSFPCSPTLTSIHDCWKNQSFDYMDLYWQSNVSAFQYAV